MPNQPFRLDNRPYFVTTVTKARQQVFADPAVAAAFIHILYATKEKCSCLLLSFVLMPDHFHAILVPAERNSISDVMRYVKGAASHELSKVFGLAAPLWQAGFYERVIRGAKDMAATVAYIEANPVGDGLVVSPEDYPYSSAYRDWPSDMETYFGGERPA